MAKKILLVEDDELLRKIITQKLEEEGYEVKSVVDGLAGLKAVREDNPDLVLLDIILPAMDGFEVLEQIKKDEAIKKTPVIILSNLWQKEDIDKGMKLGAADYLIKINFASKEILEKIKNILK
jgi:two-component system alkaline phosphatase synthesis response regulator PhoP